MARAKQRARADSGHDYLERWLPGLARYPTIKAQEFLASPWWLLSPVIRKEHICICVDLDDVFFEESVRTAGRDNTLTLEGVRFRSIHSRVVGATRA
jgi:hypothetical protein